jgi:hypothetical protein
MVICRLLSTSAHCGTNRLTRSSGAIRPSSVASKSDMPPTSAFASEAVECGRAR